MKSNEKGFLSKGIFFSISKEVRCLFHLPIKTFLWFIPWPFIWMTLAVILYIKLKREDDQETDHE